MYVFVKQGTGAAQDLLQFRIRTSSHAQLVVGSGEVAGQVLPVRVKAGAAVLFALLCFWDRIDALGVVLEQLAVQVLYRGLNEFGLGGKVMQHGAS